MTSIVESPVDYNPDKSDGISFTRNEEDHTLTILMPKGCSRGLIKKFIHASQRTKLVRVAVVKKGVITLTLRPRSNMSEDEVADAVQQKILTKYERHLQAAMPMSNTKRRKERLLKQPALATT